MSLTTVLSFISFLNQLNLLSKWYVILILGLSIGPLFSYLNLDYLIHEFLYNKFGLGKRLTEKTTLLKTFDNIFIGTTWWLCLQYVIFNPLFKFSFSNYNFIFPLIILIGFLLKFAFGRSYIFEDNFESSSKSWRFLNFWGNGTFLNQLINVWKSYSYPSLHTLILMSGLFLGVFSHEIYILAILTMVWLIITNEHWVSDVLSGLLISYCILMIQG